MLCLRTESNEFTTEITVDGETIKVTLMPMLRSEMQDLVKRYTKKDWKNHQKSEVTNWDEVARERYMGALKGWEGVVDNKGQELKCDDQTKAVVYQLNPDFVAAVLDATDSHQELEKTAAEEEQGN